MTITRRTFTALAATFFLPFPRSPRGPRCVYQTDRVYDDLPHGWLVFGANVGSKPRFSETGFNFRCIRRIDVEMVSGRPIAVIWLQDSFKAAEPARAYVTDLPSFLAEVAEYRRKVEVGGR